MKKNCFFNGFVFFLSVGIGFSPAHAMHLEDLAGTAAPREGSSETFEDLIAKPEIQTIVERMEKGDPHVCYFAFEDLLRLHHAYLKKNLTPVLTDSEKMLQVSRLVSENKLQEAIWELSEIRSPESHAMAAKIKGDMLEIMNQEPQNMVEARGSLGGTTPKFLVTFSSGISAVFKPDLSPETIARYPGWSFWYSDSQAEVAAYLLDQELQTQIVPMTVMRTLSGMRGSLQYFVKGNGETGTTAGTVPSLGATNFKSLLVFDLISRGGDRKRSNFLYDPAVNRVIAIDNGGCFNMSAGNEGGIFPLFMLKDIATLANGIKDDSRLVSRIQGANPEKIRQVLAPYLSHEKIEFMGMGQISEVDRVIMELKSLQSALR